MKIHFYNCENCENTVVIIDTYGKTADCCNEKMREIIAGETEGAQEKHIPVYEVAGDKVKVSVGSVEHPMEPEHYIEWICVETDEGVQLKKLKPNTPPRAEFCINGENIKAVYAYCNKHSLWKA